MNMKIKVIIFGSTGMIGQGVLQECLSNVQVESVLVINRHPGDTAHVKVREIVQSDFFDLAVISKDLADCNACFFCLGTSSAGLNESEYHKITYELTMNVARALLEINNEITFCYISGAGTDSSEKGRTMWARVKGKTENDLLKLPFKAVYSLRPGYIQPMNGIRSRTRLYNMLYMIFKPFYFILRHFEGVVTNTTTLGKAMITLSLNGSVKAVLESRDINEIVKKAGE